MRKAFVLLDDALIQRVFQPVCDAMMHRIGFERSTMARFFIDIASLAWIASRAGGLSNAVFAWNAGSAFPDLALLLLGLVALVSLRTLFRRAAGKLANPLRLAMQPHRAIVLLMLLADLVQPQAVSFANAADVAMLGFATFALYLGACGEPPPARRGRPRFVPAD